MFGVMTALVLAFMLGIGIAYSKGDVLRNAATEFRDIVAKRYTPQSSRCCRCIYSVFS